MGLIYIKCPCGQRLRQDERAEGLSYVVQFSHPESGELLSRCPRCELVLYAAWKAGELARAA